MNRLIIIGASGQGKVIADIAVQNGYQDIVFLDDNDSLKECAGFPVIGKTVEAPRLDGDKIVAIGNPAVRECIQKTIGTVTMIHPNAVVSRRVVLGEGTVVMAGAVINSDTTIGKGCIINTCASVDHGCKISDFVHISVGAHIAGTCSIGERTWVGAGATVSNNIAICGDCMIGAGAVVVKNANESGTYKGVPAMRSAKNGGGGVTRYSVACVLFVPMEAAA